MAKLAAVNGVRKKNPKSVTKEVRRPVSKKEIDAVLKEWAIDMVLGRRAAACIPNAIDGEVVVMSQDDLEEYSMAVVFADFDDFSFCSENGKNYIEGMRVVIDDSFKYPIVYCKGRIPEKYRKQIRRSSHGSKA
jgi:hypothetical protein